MLLRLLLFFTLTGYAVIAQMPVVQWQRNLGGSSDDFNTKISENNLGEIYMAGTSFSTDHDMAGNHGGSDVFIARINSSNGSILWKKVYGGSLNDEVIAIEAIDNGGVTVLIKSGSANGNFSQSGLWLVKFDANGTESFKLPYSGNPSGKGGLLQTSDGGFIIISNKTVTSKGLDLWVLKTTSAGAISWQQTIGGTLDEVGYDVQEMGGFFYVYGTTSSTSVNSQTNSGGDDLIVCKLNSSGVVQLTRLFGGLNDEIAGSLAVGTSFIGSELYVTATTFSDNSGALDSLSGSSDMWLFSIDEMLNNSFSVNNLVGGDSVEYAADVFFDTVNDEPWIIGTSFSAVPGDPTIPFISLYRTALGTVLGQTTLGGSLPDSASASLLLLNNNILVGGHSSSSNGNLTSNKGGKDFWIVMLGSCPDELVIENQTYGGSLTRTADRFIKVSGTTFQGSETRVKLRSNYILMEPMNGSDLGIEIKPGVVFETEIGGCP